MTKIEKDKKEIFKTREEISEMLNKYPANVVYFIERWHTKAIKQTQKNCNDKWKKRLKSIDKTKKYCKGLSKKEQDAFEQGMTTFYLKML